MEPITGKTLIDWGFAPGKWFPAAVAAANEARLQGRSPDAILALVNDIAHPPMAPLRAPGALSHHLNIIAESEDEADNIAKVRETMAELMRVPPVVAGAVMPDACPAGPIGTIPVGGIIASKEAIHPGMHSADICCSMAVSIFRDEADLKTILDAGMVLSHFGGGGRPAEARIQPPDSILALFDGNSFLKPHLGAASEHFATQGDGNHFFYVGRVASSGMPALVTHHGSRKPGAMLYKSGMQVAERYRKELSPETPAGNAWIPSETREGEAYWQALQIIRQWTKASHYAIHDRIAQALGLVVEERFWNEHNFVFRKSDGLFYHAKGATPAWDGFAEDSNGLTLIPLNMAQPILITRGKNAPHGLGFAPHGAGRNFSRSVYLRRHAGKTIHQLFDEQTTGIDARFFCGIPDASELPLAYKDAASVRRQIEHFELAEVADTIEPYGSIMAGDWQQDAPWRRKKAGDASPSADALDD